MITRFKHITGACKKFDNKQRPQKPNIGWHLLTGLVAPFLYVPVGGKIKRIDCEGLKPPYLVLSNHGSLVDFAMAVKAQFPRRQNYVSAIDEFVAREFMFRELGMIYKRKFTNDITVVRHIAHVLMKNKNILTLYPEARFSIIGVNERIDNALGKLVKMAKCPVVVFIMHGNFLRSPQWNKHPYRKVRVEAEHRQIVTREEALTLSAEEIQARIEKFFVYNDYEWQYENKIEIKSKARAHNLHKVLYQCPHCKREFSTYSRNTKIWCEECGKVWEMDTYGRLHCENGEDIFTSPVDWYNWERENVRKEVRSGNYHFEDEVRVDHLVCSRQGYVPAGTAKLTHGYDGFTLEGTLYDKPFHLSRPCETMISCHIEYGYKHRGSNRLFRKTGWDPKERRDTIDLCTLDESYFVSPMNAKNVITKIHLATEELHDYMIEQKNNQ